MFYGVSLLKWLNDGAQLNKARKIASLVQL